MLDAKLLAAVQAIGADIKALFARPIGFATTIVRTTASQAASSTALTSITSLSAAMAAGGTYRVTGRIVFQSSVLAVGAQIGLVGPTGSVAQCVIAIPTTALITTGTAMIRTNGASGSGSTTSVAAIATNIVATVDGIVTVGANAGTFALQFAASSVAGTVTVQSGSTLVVEKIG